MSLWRAHRKIAASLKPNSRHRAYNNKLRLETASGHKTMLQYFNSPSSGHALLDVV